MSIGNLKDYGNKGNNFPYQLRNLQLLSEILTASNAVVTGKQISPYLKSSTGVGDLSGFPVVYSASFSNVGASAINLLFAGSGTISLPAGKTVTFDAGLNNWYEGISFQWNATGSTLLVSFSSN
jgi:hypothetical protein